MNYQETVEWMFQQLPMYQNQGRKAYKSDLDNIIKFSKHLNNPEKNFKTIHVAGTNGKGSTSSMLTSVLMESGLSIGLYTSPHLKDYRERITINGSQIEEEFVIEFIKKNKSFLAENQLSFFEMSVGLAFEYFNVKKVNIAVVEVGLGGRLDATNIITPLLSIITSIGLDHQEFLGDTLNQIAFEKAGIIKPTIPVVIGETTQETIPVFNEIASNNHSKIIYSENESFIDYKSDLLGYYQKQNIRTARTAIEVLKTDYGLKIEENDVVNGFIKTKQNTGLKGRWEILSKKPFIVADCAHNKHGLKAVLAQLKNMSFRKIHFVLGFVKEKDLTAILPLFPKDGKYYFTKPNNNRALNEKQLMEEAKKFELEGSHFETVSAALAKARINAEETDCIYIGGSTFVVSDVI